MDKPCGDIVFEWIWYWPARPVKMEVAMKRILCAVTALTLFITLLTACGGPRTALSIGGAQISSEIYTYYYDLVKRSPKTYPGDARENAVNLCKEYVAVNTLAAELSLSLQTKQEASASAWVNQQWKFFSSYYTSLGISKQALMKVRENEERRKLLLDAYYGADGLQPVADEELKAYFSSHFVVFKSINGYLTDTNDVGEPVALSDERVAEIKQQFNTMADNIRNGTSIEEVNTKYLEAQKSAAGGELAASVIDGQNTDYPEGFYEQVAAMKNGDVKVITLSTFIYVVQKMDALGDEGSYFTQYRTDVLQSMKGEDFEKLLQERENSFEVDEKGGTLKRCEKAVDEKHTKESGTAQAASGAESTGASQPQQTESAT